MVFLVLDELPVATLMDGRGRINPLRYPHLADLAGDATWYSGAVATSGSTHLMLPVIFGHLVLPKPWAQDLPPISQGWTGFERPREAPTNTPSQDDAPRGQLSAAVAQLMAPLKKGPCP